MIWQGYKFVEARWLMRRTLQYAQYPEGDGEHQIRYIRRPLKSEVPDAYGREEGEPDLSPGDFWTVKPFDEFVTEHVLNKPPLSEWGLEFVPGTLLLMTQPERPHGVEHADTDFLVVIGTYTGRGTEILIDDEWVETPKSNLVVLAGCALQALLAERGIEIEVKLHRSPRVDPVVDPWPPRYVIIGRYFPK
jgi:hypothetical protein